MHLNKKKVPSGQKNYYYFYLYVSSGKEIYLGKEPVITQEKIKKYGLDLEELKQVEGLKIAGFEPETQPIIGRIEELKQIDQYMKKGRDILLVGPEGVGKSALLKQVAGKSVEGRELIYLEESSPPKDFLISLCQELHQREVLQLQDISHNLPNKWRKQLADKGVESIGWGDLSSILPRFKIRELTKLVVRSIAESNREFLLLLDHLERVTPSQQPVLEALLKRCQVVGATSKKRESIKTIWHSFSEVKIEGLDQESTDQLVTKWLEEHDVFVEDPQMLKNQLYKISQGNPKALEKLLVKVETEGNIDSEFIRTELETEEHHRYFDLTPYLIIIAGAVMAVRYVGLGMGDRGLYILAGVGYAVAIIMRSFVWRWQRTPSRD